MLINEIGSLAFILLGVVLAILVMLGGLAILTYYLSCPFMIMEMGTDVKRPKCLHMGEDCPKLKFLRFKQCSLFWEGMEEVLKQ